MRQRGSVFSPVSMVHLNKINMKKVLRKAKKMSGEKEMGVSYDVQGLASGVSCI